MKIAICGSMIFSKEMVEIADKLEQKNHEIILPRNAEKRAKNDLTNETSHESIRNKVDNDLIRDYFNKIKNADAILVVNMEKNKVKSYIGGNSFLEMGFAHALNKEIFLLSDIPEMIYTDEIKAMQPIILRGDLERIN